MAMQGRPAARPSELARVQDRISFVYLERCVVHRDANAITATDERGTVHIPSATLGALLLGPGTRVSHQAMVLLAESASTAVWVGENGVRYYAHGQSLARSARLLQAQAEAVPACCRPSDVCDAVLGRGCQRHDHAATSGPRRRPSSTLLSPARRAHRGQLEPPGLQPTGLRRERFDQPGALRSDNLPLRRRPRGHRCARMFTGSRVCPHWS